MTLRLNLGRYLKEHDITAYRLVQEVQGHVAPNTVYSLARKPAQRIDLQSVQEILNALSRVQGTTVEITDMLEDIAPPIRTTAEPTYDPSNRKTFRHNGYRVNIAPGPCAEDIIAELRGRKP